MRKTLSPKLFVAALSLGTALPALADSFGGSGPPRNGNPRPQPAPSCRLEVQDLTCLGYMGSSRVKRRSEFSVKLTSDCQYRVTAQNGRVLESARLTPGTVDSFANTQGRIVNIDGKLLVIPVFGAGNSPYIFDAVITGEIAGQKVIADCSR